MKTLLIATTNPGKVREVRHFFANYSINIVPYLEVLPDLVIDETHFTYIDNAREKAETLSKLTNMPVLADDSGFEIVALPHMLGVFSARYEPTLDYLGKSQKILELMQNKNDRKGFFITALTLAIPGQPSIFVEARVLGTVATAIRGEYGFGYDPIFIPEGQNKTYGEMLIEEKQHYSHRFQALRLIEPFIKMWEGDHL